MRLLAILPLFNILMATVQNHCYFSYWHIYTNGRLYLSPRSLENMDVVKVRNIRMVVNIPRVGM
jgi:hypothetical protein